MSKLDEKPVVLSKRRNIQTLIDYCLDQRVAFTVTPRAISNDDFEVEVDIEGIKQAIALGMFIKENKFDITGMGEWVKPKAVAATAKKTDPKEVSIAKPVNTTPEPAKEEGSLLSFDLNVNGN
ncbi:MAG: hypothetical protein Q8M15_15480 [Bacteroidota bacterium]|nr:hypothetical protein [Bacteroidota bacterium]